MIKLKIDDFVYEVKEEISCYEELGREGADEWENNFRKWLNDGKKKKHIKGQGEEAVYMIEDESDIFDIADEYLQAAEENKINEYWKKFQ